jgi:hypothetical protein
MSVLNLFPARIRWCNADGTLTPEALRMLEVLVARVGGTMGDVGADVFAPPEPMAPSAAPDVGQHQPGGEMLAEMVQQPVPAIPGTGADLVQQPAPYRAGTALGLVDYSFALQDTTVAPGSYGDAANVAKFTVDQQGRLVLAQSVPIAVTAGQVSGLGTMAAQNVGTNFTGSFTGKTVTVSNGIITSVV